MVKTYTISEFLNDEHHKYTFDMYIKNVRQYFEAYQFLIVLFALVLHATPIYAANFEANLNESANQIIDLLLMLAQYSFLGLGLKEIIAVVVAGGTFKEAASAGIQYLLTYILIKIYPSLFGMFSDIKF